MGDAGASALFPADWRSVRALVTQDIKACEKARGEPSTFSSRLADKVGATIEDHSSPPNIALPIQLTC